jgi:zinc/manganese transport system substrate-binding protein
MAGRCRTLLSLIGVTIPFGVMAAGQRSRGHASDVDLFAGRRARQDPAGAGDDAAPCQWRVHAYSETRPVLGAAVRARLALAALNSLLALATPAPASPPALRVSAATPTLASLVQNVGGDQVAVTVLAEAGGPSLAAALGRSRLVVLRGGGLDPAWVTQLLRTARTAALRPGGHGHLDVSRIAGLRQNPHCLLDPVGGLAVADAVRGTLELLRPDSRRAFEERFQAFRARLGTAMLGERLGGKYPLEKVAELYRLGTFESFLGVQREGALLGGWFGALRPARDIRAAANEDAWTCFARRFGIDVVALAGQPAGEAPPKGDAGAVRLVLAGPGPESEWERAVAERSGAPVVHLAREAGEVPGTDDYVALVDHDVRAIAAALPRSVESRGGGS